MEVVTGGGWAVTTTSRAVPPDGGGVPGTVKPLITRLLRKQAIEGRREADGYFYRPLISRSDYVQSESQGLVDRLFDGEVAPLVAHFAEHRALSAKDIKLIKQLIADLE